MSTTKITRATPPPTFEDIQVEKDERRRYRLIKRHGWDKFLSNKAVCMALCDIQVDGVLDLELFTVNVTFSGKDCIGLLIEFNTSRNHCCIYVLPVAVRNYTVERAQEYIETLKRDSLANHGKFEAFVCSGFVSKRGHDFSTLEMV